VRVNASDIFTEHFSTFRDDHTSALFKHTWVLVPNGFKRWLKDN